MNPILLRKIAISALILCGVQAKALLHEFELKDGRTIKAEVVRFNSALGQVDLEREDGKRVKVKANIFTAKDQNYIKQWKSPPKGVVPIHAGTNTGTDPDFGDYSITVNGFYMDEYEVTSELWEKVYKWAISHGYEFDNSGDGKGAKYPVQMISWYDSIKWCNARSEMENRKPAYFVNGTIYKDGQHAPECDFDTNGFRLPTCKEWEYAARGGLVGKRFPWGDTISHDLANYNASSSCAYDESSRLHPEYRGTGDESDTSPVGSFPPNAYGLYDMVGNVNEFNWDELKGGRSTRGCSCTSAARYGRCGADDASNSPDFIFSGLGFRTVCK
ncbi:MAG: SUMF1/EgtB/PvdO family nonheme iron enzyme [Pontiella sp.]